jgi:hypothetical protein
MNVIIFADNASSIITAHIGDEITVGHNLTKNLVSKWFEGNRLLSNPAKTEVLNFNLNKQPYVLNLIYAGQFLPEVETKNSLVCK